jgi:hypothetical protein
MTIDAVKAPPARTTPALVRPAWVTGTLLLVVGCLALGALSLLLPSTPTYDPWAWIIWGREVLHLDLSTVGGPSWKPLPVLFTAPFSLFGDAAPDLWLMIARAGGLLALAMAFRLARRLAGDRWGLVAGIVAALTLFTSTGYLRAVWPGNSEGLLLALLLWAVECHVTGHRHRAFILGALAALLRPETWPFLAAYGIWLMWRDRRSRALVLGSAAGVLALWFLPELWGSGELLRAAERANNPDPQSPAFAANPAFQVVKNYGASLTWPLFALGGVAIGWALSRREWAVAWLALGAAAWVALVALMTQAGYSGNPRYLMPVTAVLCVLVGVGVARILDVVPAPRASWLRVAIAAALVLVIGAVIYDRTQLDAVTNGLRGEAQQADQLDGVLARAGGAKRIVACGVPYTGAYQVPALAWRLNLHTIQVGFIPRASGTIFRADGAVRMPPAPHQPPWRELARDGRWQVYGNCG